MIHNSTIPNMSKSPSFPSKPGRGDMWIDTSYGNTAPPIYVYDDTVSAWINTSYVPYSTILIRNLQKRIIRTKKKWWQL